jgi:hypothetical protein
MMYAEYVLRVRVDWSSLDALKEKKFGRIGIAYTKCTVLDIPYIPIPEWFRTNLKLVDEPMTLFPEGREPKMLRNRRRVDNDMETVIGEAFTNMDDGREDMKDQQNIAELGGDTLESKMEELRKQHTEKIREYKAMILDLENQVATLTMGGLAIQILHQLQQ